MQKFEIDKMRENLSHTDFYAYCDKRDKCYSVIEGYFGTIDSLYSISLDSLEKIALTVKSIPVLSIR